MTSARSVEGQVRDLAPRALGVLVRRSGDFADAEDAVQEAVVAALAQWPEQGVPDNPLGWLIRVAGRRLTDAWRRDSARRRREDLAASWTRVEPAPAPAGEDDTIVLMYLCCHPALTRASAVALTLRAVGGLTTAEIAAAFLVPVPTMAQRISRAKDRIRGSALPFRLPTDAEQAERLQAVLHVLYLIFTEGHTTSAGDHVVRPDLSGEAIRLARLVHAGLPDDPEVTGLLALLLLTDARRDARVGPVGELVPLAEQDRTRWDRAQITEGTVLVTEALATHALGPYQLQAAVAALHDQARRVDDTDWDKILVLYGLLDQLADNPMVSLNRAIAAAMVHGPATGLELLDALDERLAGNHRLDAARAHLHEQAGDHDAAIAHYRAAAARTTSRPEQQYLTLRAARLAHDG